ncbi:tetratricopeptide repeat-containing sulfotransferase family protein [Paraglaciecola aestuariivivens]
MQNIAHSKNHSLDEKYLINLAPQQVIKLADEIVNNNPPKEAADELERLVKVIPEQAQLWKILENLYLTNQATAKAQQASQQFNLITDFNQKLEQANARFNQGQIQAAEHQCRELLSLVPNEIRCLRLMAKISSAAGRPDVRLAILSHCVTERPLDCQLAIEYIDALIQTSQAAKALDYAQKQWLEHPDNIGLLAVTAKAEVKVGDYAQAQNSYQKLLALQPDNSLGMLRLGNLCKIQGKLQEALNYYHQALTINPQLGEAYWNLANTKTYRFSALEISKMRELASGNKLDQHNLSLINFALGKALEDQQHYAQSFSFYQTANQILAKGSSYTKNNKNAALKQHFNSTLFANRQVPKANENEAIFIVGLPRSGSTLVEQILASHSLIDGTMELTAMPQIVHSLDIGKNALPGQYPAAVEQLTQPQLEQLAQRYLDAVSPFRQGGKYFIDKLPANFQHIGLICLLFPKAKIIDVRRHPMACSWSIYSQFFASGVPYANDLKSIAEHYKNYIELMQHWHSVLPNNIMTVNYEDLIKQFKPTVEKLLDFCQVDFEESCLSYFTNTRPVATPSAEQVRQAPYLSSLERWRHFEAYLSPIRQVLGPNLVD